MDLEQIAFYLFMEQQEKKKKQEQQQTESNVVSKYDLEREETATSKENQLRKFFS